MIRASRCATRLRISLYLRYNPLNLVVIYRCDLTPIFAFFSLIITLNPCRKRSQVRNMPYIVALTGGIGSGKSTIAQAFAASGVDIIDADLIAREVVEPGTPALQAIKGRYGASIVTEQGMLDRKQDRKSVV